MGVLLGGLLLVASLLGCQRPPVHRDPEDAGPVVTPPGTIAPDMEAYYNDRYALGHKWYLHDSGVLTPKDEVYLIADRDAVPTAYYKLEVTSYYGAASGDSGYFTIAHAAWDGAAWGAAQTLVLSHSVKDGEPPICVDLASNAEVACAGSAWQVQFAAPRYLSPTIFFILAYNPGIYVRSTSGQPDVGDVHLAVVEAADLEAVTLDPTAVGDLVEAPPATFGSTEFDHDVWAVNIPQNGMALGRSWYDPSGASRQHVYFLRTMDFTFVKLTIVTEAPANPPSALTLRYQAAELEQDEETGYYVTPLEGADVVDAAVTLPAAHGVVFIDFSSDPPVVDLGGDLLRDVPLASDWDLAFEVTQGGVQVLVSPAALFWNWTESPDGAGSTDFENAQPPLY